MQQNANISKQTQAHANICKQMSANAAKCNQMQMLIDEEMLKAAHKGAIHPAGRDIRWRRN